MPDLRRANCQNCHRPASEVGPISWRGNCVPCAKLLSDQAQDNLDAHSGPIFDRWRERVAASVGAVLLDAAQRPP